VIFHTVFCTSISYCNKLFSENADAAFYSGKIASTKYFVSNVVSQAASKANLIMNGDRAALEIAESCF
jgi:hypothetical protein